MNSNKNTTGIDMKAKLSTLWIFLLFNVVFRDIHELFRPGFLAEIMTGSVNGVQMTEGLLLQAGIMMEIPIVMVVLSRILEYRANRWANIIGGAIGLVFVVITKIHDLDDIFFAAVEVVTALLIVWYAWKWPKPEA